MVRFEQRYGGLWYRAIGENGLEGDPVFHETAFGLAISAGIIDGDWTWPVHVLLDGRTMMDLGQRIPPGVIDFSVEQRIESHALLAEVRSWPHQVFQFSLAPSIELETGAVQSPPLVPEATGPANRWWADEHRAIHASLHSWWGLETWTVRCFARDAAGLADLAQLSVQVFVDAVTPDKTWCSLCGRFVQSDVPCPMPPDAGTTNTPVASAVSTPSA